MKPFWLNIYGAPISTNNEESKSMAINGHKVGTAYKGRILIKLSSRPE